MTKERKEFLMYLAGIVVLFVAGIVIGYYVWGVEREKKPDYTKYLSKTIEYIESMEKANLVLIEKADALQEHIASMNDEANDPAKLKEQIGTLTKEIEELKKKNTSMQSVITENEERLKNAAALQVEHDNLLNEVAALVIERDALQLAVDDSQNIYEENERLKGVIQKLADELDASKAQIEAVKQLVKPETEIQPEQ
ncbi:MAG: hypothetical protein JW743_07365 [Deltaproteobacteria bacterium]|nr:hypothetical protein [Deltaproteobacteria bacterium]